ARQRAERRGSGATCGGADRRDADTGVLARSLDALIGRASVPVVAVDVGCTRRDPAARVAELVRVLAWGARPARLVAALVVDRDEASPGRRRRRAASHAELIRE